MVLVFLSLDYLAHYNNLQIPLFSCKLYRITKSPSLLAKNCDMDPHIVLQGQVLDRQWARV